LLQPTRAKGLFASPTTIDSPEDGSYDDWLTPIAAKNWIADAQITPDCLVTKEQCSVLLSGISLLSPESNILSAGGVNRFGEVALVRNSPEGDICPAGVLTRLSSLGVLNDSKNVA
jgi:hypothetical protein